MAVQITDKLEPNILWQEVLEPAGAPGIPLEMNEERFQSLYDATARPILAYLIGVTGRRDVADDVLQETYCRFLARQVTAMDADETRRYLFRIATNLLRDRWRAGEEAQFPESFDHGYSQDADSQMDVRRVMQSLKPRERELLWLAYVEGMSHKEIAAATGLSALSIRLLLFRARGNAAELLRPAPDRKLKERA